MPCGRSDGSSAVKGLCCCGVCFSADSGAYLKSAGSPLPLSSISLIAPPAPQPRPYRPPPTCPLARSKPEGDRACDLVVPVVRNFGNSLRHGCKNIFESLPRLLTLYFEHKQIVPKGSAGNEVLAEVRAAMQELKGALPLWVWITALPQLISRICHPDRETADFLQGLLVDLLLTFPDQARTDHGRTHGQTMDGHASLRLNAFRS